MELINLYVQAVAKKLPKRMRKDISSEIRSILVDMLADRKEQENIPAEKPAGDEMVMDLLREYGSPEQVAATYLPERYLVGPQLYPFFTLVVKIVIAVLTVLALVGLGIAISAGAPNIGEIVKVIGRSLAQYYTGVITAFGNIVLVFVILERVLPEKEKAAAKHDDEAWDPADLLKESEPAQVSLWEPILAILFTFAALVLFNFYPEVLRYTPSLNEPNRLVYFPILSAAFFSYLPWLNVQWLLQIGLNIGLLRSRRWTVGNRLFSILIKGLGIGILIAMLRGPSLLDFTGLSSAGAGFEGVQALSSLLNTIVRVALVLGVFGSAVEIIKDVVRMFKATAKD